VIEQETFRLNRQAAARESASSWIAQVYQKDGCAPYVNTLYTSIGNGRFGSASRVFGELVLGRNGGIAVLWETYFLCA